MADPISNELIFEILKSLQDGLAKANAALSDMGGQLIRIREEMNGLRSDMLRQERMIAALQLDVERINKRLGLLDPAL